MMNNEIWKDIEGYEGYYQVSNLGRVKSLERVINNGRKSTRFQKERMLTLTEDVYGYSQVILSKEGKHRICKVHRLVLGAFVPNKNNLPQVNHKDEDKKNNNVTNLEWCDAKYNNNYGKHNDWNKKKVAMYDLEGNKLREFDSIREAVKFLNKFSSPISKVCHGERNKAYGYKWCFVGSGNTYDS